MRCPNCSNEIKDGSKFCPYCGNHINKKRSASSNREVKSNSSEGKTKKRHPILVTLIIILLLAIVVVVGLSYIGVINLGLHFSRNADAPTITEVPVETQRPEAEETMAEKPEVVATPLATNTPQATEPPAPQDESLIIDNSTHPEIVTDNTTNDTSQGAQFLILGDTINGSIAPEGDVDFYSFELKVSGCVTLDITSYMNYYSLYIYDTTGGELWYTDYNEYNSTVGFREDVYDVYLEQGSYYLKVMGFRYGESYASTGDYEIQTGFTSANANEVETNNSVAEANQINLGDTIAGLIGENDRFDFFELQLPESGRVTLDITSYMPYYTLIIYDITGSELWYTDYNEYNSTVGFREDVYNIDLEAGAFFLKVTGYRYGESYASTGTYNIQTAFIPSNANEIETNNGAAEANHVEMGDMVTGLIGENDRYDFYEFSIATGSLKLNIQSRMKYYTAIIYDDKGEEVWYTDFNEYIEETGHREDSYSIDLKKGVYYLKINGYKYGDSYASTGTYSFTLTQ